MSSRWSEKAKIKKRLWTVEEDTRLLRYIKLHGDHHWSTLAKAAGLQRSGRSCRLRWLNHLRPDLKRSNITPEEERIIIHLHDLWGTRWSQIAERIPGRTDNEIKNYWRTHAKKKLESSPPTQNIGNQSCSPQVKKLTPAQQNLKAIKPLISYENNYNHAVFNMETPIDIEKVQVQVRSSFLGSSEVEGSIWNDMVIAGHDAVEISRMSYSFLWGTPIESFVAQEFEASCSANPDIIYPTHECAADSESDVMLWNI